MDIYQIIITHNRIGTMREMVCFAIVMVFAGIAGIFLVRQRRISVGQLISGLLALLFLGIVFGSTVFTRNPGQRKYKLELFWSWKAILGIGQAGANTSPIQAHFLIQENLLNMLLLMPLGVLLPFVNGKRTAAWKGLLAGIVVSSTIEVLQLLLCRGLFEFDDIIHNSIGCMAGCVIGDLIYRGIQRGWRKRK